MKLKQTIKLASLFCCLAACSEPKSADQLTLQGSIAGVDSGTVVMKRHNISDRTSTTLDSVSFTEGRFELNSKLDVAELVNITISPGNWNFSLFAENNPITVELDTTGAEHFDWTAYGGDKGARLKNPKVTGSASHELLTSYQEHPERLRFQNYFVELNKRAEAADGDTRNSIRQEGDSMRTASQEWEWQWLDSVTTAVPDSPVSAYFFHQYFMFNESLELAKMEQIMQRFQGEAKESQYYQSLEEDYNRKVALQPGKVAPDFTALHPDSTEFQLSSTRGKLVLLDFWASWCVPCRQSIPHWKEVYAKYHDKGFEIVGVTNDSKWEAWEKALEEENMPWIQVADDFPVKNMPARIGTQYMIPFLPTYVLLDEEGKIILHNGSKEEVTAEIEKRLGSEV